MTRKHSAYRRRPVSIPMLINRGLQENVIAAQEHMLVKAFVGGWATTEHFDNLVEMRNVLTLAADHKNDASAIALCDAMRIPLANLRQRYDTTGRLGVTGDELQLLRVFVDGYRDFWMRQPMARYEAACDELGRFNGAISTTEGNSDGN